MDRINILKILLPNNPPIAISSAPMRTAAIETAISGKEVLAARNNVPTNDLINPADSAICSAKKGNASAATIMIRANPI